MGRVIQLVPTAPGIASIFITDFNMETSLLSYRSSRAPERICKETVVADDKGNVQIEAGFFHQSFLDKFIQENQQRMKQECIDDLKQWPSENRI